MHIKSAGPFSRAHNGVNAFIIVYPIITFEKITGNGRLCTPAIVSLRSLPVSLFKPGVTSVLPLRLSLVVSEHPRHALAFKSLLAVCLLPHCKPGLSVVVGCFPWACLLQRSLQHNVRPFWSEGVTFTICPHYLEQHWHKTAVHAWLRNEGKQVSGGPITNSACRLPNPTPPRTSKILSPAQPPHPDSLSIVFFKYQLFLSKFTIRVSAQGSQCVPFFYLP